jgi:hypothetical protein
MMVFMDKPSSAPIEALPHPVGEPTVDDVWLSEFQESIRLLSAQVGALREPAPLAANLGNEWFRMSQLLQIASDALWLANDLLTYPSRRPR